MEQSYPKSLKDLRGFTGFVGYYRGFIKDYLKITAKLTNITRRNPLKFYWSPAKEIVFKRLK